MDSMEQRMDEVDFNTALPPVLAETSPGTGGHGLLHSGDLFRARLWALEVTMVPAWLNRLKFVSEHGRMGRTHILLGIRFSNLHLPVLTGSANTLPRKEYTGILWNFYIPVCYSQMSTIRTTTFPSTFSLRFNFFHLS